MSFSVNIVSSSFRGRGAINLLWRGCMEHEVSYWQYG